MRRWEIMKRCCPLWQVNGFSIRCRKTAPTQKANHVMNLWNQHLLKRDSISFSVHSVWSGDCLESARLCVGWLALFVLMRWEASKDKGLWRFHCLALSFDSQTLRYVLSCYCVEIYLGHFIPVTLHSSHSHLPCRSFRSIKGAMNFMRKLRAAVSITSAPEASKTWNAAMNFALCISEEVVWLVKASSSIECSNKLVFSTS